MLKFRFYTLLFFAAANMLLSKAALAKDPLVLDDAAANYYIDSNYFERIELNTPSFSLPVKVVPNDKRYFSNREVHKDYWFRFQLTNENPEVKDWLIISYFYTIDEIDVLIQDSSGKFTRQFFRDTMTLYSRMIQHKQPTFQITLQPHETKTVYVKINNESIYEYSFGVYSHFHFLSTYFREQLVVGLFYGFMLFVLIYSIINYLFFRNNVILLYIVFILCQMTHMLFRDGNGLYILPYFAEYADLIKNLSRASVSVFLLLYTLKFLRIKRTKLTFKLVMAFILVRIVFALIMLNNTSLLTFTFEFSAIMISTFLSVKASISRENDAKYMAIGLSALCFSYFIFYLSVVWLSVLGDIGFFILYFGIAAESIFTTLALMERFKRIRVDNSRKDQMYKELERTVAERTELITIQNKVLKEQSNELNLFLYSASHDLKGPLKSIEGLINLAEKDPEVNHQQIYSMIREKLDTLDSHISDLTSVTTLKNKGDKTEVINFNKIHQETIKKFQQRINPEEITISLHVNITNIFQSDSYAISTIYENIVDNALKFRDQAKKSILMITIEQRGNNLHLHFEDNGIGIEKNKMQNIFNMFYRGNELSRNDTGLGLYIVKIAVKKLNGEVTLESVHGQGTTFHITIPYIK